MIALQQTQAFKETRFLLPFDPVHIVNSVKTLPSLWADRYVDDSKYALLKLGYVNNHLFSKTSEYFTAVYS